jgi:DNA-binding NarL/FixJ family response regulator
MLNAVTVVLADDDILLRESLASLLAQSGFDVLGQASDATELLELVGARQPSLAVVDIRMPPTYSSEGLGAAWTIRQKFPHTGVLVLSAYVEVGIAVELLLSERATGYLLKSRVTDVPELVDALHRIAHGSSVIDPTLVAELLSARRRDNPLSVLSRREYQVLALMAEGRSNAGIARRLSLAEGTVQVHVHRIVRKLNLSLTDDDHRRVRAVIAYLDAQ